MMIWRTLKKKATVVLLAGGFLFPGSPGGFPGSFTAVTPSGDALSTLLAGLDPREYVLIHDAAQTGGILDVAPANTADVWGINADGNDWRQDAIDEDGGYGDGYQWTDNNGAALKSWTTAVMVDKPSDTKIYVPGMGGHANYGGNEVYSLDVTAAAVSLNAAGNGAIWVRENDPARIGYVRHLDSPYAVFRGHNTNHPYRGNYREDDTDYRRAVWDSADPFGADQRHVGPMSTHGYGGLIYDEELDALLIYGQSVYGLGPGVPSGFWLWSLLNDRWELLPDDHALGAGAEATTGNFLLSGINGSTPWEYTLMKWDTDRYAMVKWNQAIRIRLDGSDWNTDPEAAPNGMAQETGSWSGTSYSGGVQASLAPHNSEMGAYLFAESGGAVVWPAIDQPEETNNNSVNVAYGNAVPGDPDMTSVVYAPIADAFYFIQKSWLAGFTGTVYKLNRSDMMWSTHITGADGPTTTPDGSNNGARGRFGYIESRDVFYFFHGSTGVAGEAWLLKGAG